MKKWILLLRVAITFSASAAALGSEWYVSTAGLSGNAGTSNSPWDIASALVKSSTIKPGDTLWLMGGTYYHPTRTPGAKGWPVNLVGSEASPIVIRNYRRQRVIIDGGLYSGASMSHVRIWGLEVIVSENLTQPRVSQQTGSAPTDLNRPWGGIDITSGTNIKLIHNFIHDNAQGVGFWKSVGGNSELCGNVICNNGWIGPDRYHGPGIYSQNLNTSSKYIRENIVLGNYSEPMQLYGSAAAAVDNYFVWNNVFRPKDDSGRNKVVFGGEGLAHNHDVRSNTCYNGTLQIGYSGGIDTVSVISNFTSRGSITYVGAVNVTAYGNFQWPSVDPTPAQPKVFLNPSPYETGRANLTILQWAGAATVPVSFPSFLGAGAVFELRDPTNFFGPPILRSVYQGSPVNVPMGGQEFAAFVVLTGDSVNQPPAVSITAPADRATVAASSAIGFTAEASDSDGSVAKVEFFRNGTSIGSDTTSPYGTTWSGAAAGSYSLTAVATDDSGAVTTSQVVNITVVSGITSVRSGYWTNAATWSGNQAPAITDNVYILSGHTVTNQDKLVHNVGSLTIQTNGVLTHTANGGTELYKIILNVASNLTIDAGGRIDVNEKGHRDSPWYSAGGPGMGQSGASGYASGASYGGVGGIGSASTSAPTYGSLTAPTNLGSSARGTPGGGAVILTVAGATTVDGAILADGGSLGDESGGGAGSGGSLFITTGTFGGSGTLSARGGAGSVYGGGGGGRIAVILTNGASFGSVAMRAHGGSGGTGGGAGTVFIRNAAQGTGKGTLVVDAGNMDAGAPTLLGSNVTDTVVGTVIITNLAKLKIDSNQMLTVNGDWQNSASFIGTNAGATVTFAGTNAALIKANNAFCNLTCTNAGKVLSFEAGKTNTVNGLLKLGAAAPAIVTLRSATAGSQWRLTLSSGTGSQQIGRVSVRDSHAGGGQVLTAEKGSVNDGNNVNWYFPKWPGAVFVLR